jgi:murein L,D-transpeptidase YcbB/YkuD
MVPFRTLLWRGAALVILVACGRSSSYFGGEVSRSWNPTAVKEVSGVPIDSLRLALRHELGKKPTALTNDQWGHVKRLYAGYQSSPLWMDEDGVINDRANALIDGLVEATTDAIQIDQYALTDLAHALDTLRRTKQPTAAQLARADLLLTMSYTALAEDYLTGQIEPASVAQSWHIDPQEEEVDSALTRSLRDGNLGDAIKRMRPQDYDYEMLRRMLADYRKIVASGGWPIIPDGKSLKRGDKDAPSRLQALRLRLQAEGIRANVGDSSSVYDQALASAVAQFQTRHAIGVDSALGKETLDALNVPATFRLAQIAANLERDRWLPRALGSKYILVNVPAFRLQGYENGKKTIEMKVIVGSEFEGRATPVFSDSLELVVFRPYWDVPDKIAENELLPRGVPADFVTTTQNGKLHLRQRPGPKNALGLVKFLFPNDFNIYLHDTPQDELFEKDVRAFSHGCIRLEKPTELAQLVLGWDAAKVEDQMHNGPNDHRVTLPRKIPVYIVYETAYLRNGQLFFGNDLYDRDDQLVRAVFKGAVPNPATVQAVQALRRIAAAD